MTTITQTITAMPTAPARNQAPTTFIANADASLAAEANRVSEMNTWAGQANTVAGEVNANAATATTQAGIATSEAGIATTKAGLTAADAIATAADRVQTGLDRAAALSSVNDAANYAASLKSTSTTSLAIGTGSKTWITQASKSYAAGMFVLATSDAGATNFMHGQVTSYIGTSLVVNVLDIGGSGTKADWTISVSGSQGPIGPSGSVDSSTLATTIHAATEKATPVSNDEFALIDSAASNVLKKITFADLVAMWRGANSFTGAQNFARASVASAATTADIWGAAGNQIDFTGTATVTAFPNAPQAGASRRLICAGACSFTAGANMLIAGVTSGNTVTCAANDIIDVEAVSTTQFKITRIKYDGTPQVAPSSGGLILISTQSIASVDNVTWTGLDSTYDNYVMFINRLITGSICNIYLQFGYGGTPNWSTSDYDQECIKCVYTGTVVPNYFVNGTGVLLTPDVSAAADVYSGKIDITDHLNPDSASSYPTAHFHIYNKKSAQLAVGSGQQDVNYNTVATAMRLKTSTGVFTSGIASLYGVAK